MDPLKEVLLDQEPYELKDEEIIEVLPDIVRLNNKNVISGLNSFLPDNLSLMMKLKKPKNFLEHLSMNERKEVVTWITLHFKF